MKKPGRMRWDYDQPRPKLFLTDGHTAWFYVPGEQQARRTPVKQLDDLRSPLRYMLGKTKLEKELDGLSLAPDQKPINPGDVVLRGVPKGMGDRVEQTLLEVTPDGLIVRIVVEELDGSVTEFRFLQQQENVEIADSNFASLRQRESRSWPERRSRNSHQLSAISRQQAHCKYFARTLRPQLIAES